MRKLFLMAIALLLIIASSTVIVNTINVNSDPSMFQELNVTPPSLVIHSPQNTTYNSNNLTLNLTAEIGQLPQIPVFGEEEVRSIQLEADWMTNITTIQLSYVLSENDFHTPIYPENASYNLENIPDGNHTLKICAFETGLVGWNASYTSETEINENSSATVNFAIDTTSRPSPNIPKLSLLAIAPLFLLILPIVAILRHRKTVKKV